MNRSLAVAPGHRCRPSNRVRSGVGCRNPARERASDRRRTPERIARGDCTKCGVNAAESGRRLCEPCAEKRRTHERVRYGAARDRGELYGGKDPRAKRKAARAASARRRRTRLDAERGRRCPDAEVAENGSWRAAGE